MKRLIYLPDPTVKFYICIDEDDKAIYSDTEQQDIEHDLPTSKALFKEVVGELLCIEVLERIRLQFINHPNWNPYFTDLFNKIELYEIVETEN